MSSSLETFKRSVKTHLLPVSTTNYMHALKAQTNRYNDVNQSNHLFCPSAHTLGSPAARGTIVPRETGAVRGEAIRDALVPVHRQASN